MANTSSSADSRMEPAGTSGRAQAERAARRPPRAPYRYDLDGLRGFAIALVVIYHVWALGISGGVDVFLTLSGFFFVGMLVRNARYGSDLSPFPMMKRLARRLLPALVTILSAVGIAAFFLMPSTQWATISGQSVASLFYFQNWQLARTAGDYLAADPTTSPLQHLWSMSVQGQFFVATLAIVYLTAWLTRTALRNRDDAGTWAARAAIVVLTLCAAASFAYAAISIQQDPATAYYDSFARGWELLAGGLVAAYLPLLRIPTLLRPLLALAGLAAIMLCGIVVDGRLFPGPWALVPVLATLAIIAAGTPAANTSTPRDHRPTAILRFLALPPLVWLGSVAYSFYLWHWPVLIFYLAASGQRSVSIGEGIGVIFVSLFLAWLTLRFVEIPLRYPHRNPAPSASRIRWRHRSTYPAIALAVAALMLVGAAGGWRVYLNDREERLAEYLDPLLYPGATELTDGLRASPMPWRPVPLDAWHDHPITAFDGCIADTDSEELVTCEYGDLTADRTIVLAGGSHAEQWVTALNQVGLDEGFRVVTYLKMACPLSANPEPTHFDGFPYPQCWDWNQRVLADVAASQPDYLMTNSTRPIHFEPGDYLPDHYREMFQFLSDNGIATLGLRDSPWLPHFPEPSDCLASGGDPEECGISRAEVLSAANPADELEGEIPGFVSLDLSDAICDVDVCRAVEGNILVYRDFNHLSASYVRTTVPEMRRQIGEATGWWEN
ncbi:acyltransferase family protein [Hoyosella altamirensis]|uniref:Peptidoglycan/LPS O-acetylase OafA/YrhL n=1 Tax=Hoyosella altamirensis TaxID=616997 RepID=A0A839RR61_9ACTN|nr:acyltransferase family protein [Hoyosella altamirensis]MBB3038809.1 peptidoglycan/LPS O-acetylase OafA/YrhL [Hoyosella altamirensis]